MGPRGEPIYVQGAEPDAIFVLVHGRCDLMLATSQSTALQVIDDLFVGDVFGLASFFMEYPRMGSCLALSEVHVLRLSADKVHELIAADVELGRRVRIALIRALAASLREANGHLVDEEVGDQQQDHLRRARAVILSCPTMKPLGG